MVSLGYAFYVRQRATRALSWPSAEGTVIQVSIKHAGSGPPSTDAPGAQPTEWFQPVVLASYTVRGRTYKTDRMFLGEVSNMPHENALYLVQPYRDGMKVRVYYNPANPSYGVLNPRPYGGTITQYLLVGIVLLLFSIYDLS